MIACVAPFLLRGPPEASVTHCSSVTIAATNAEPSKVIIGDTLSIDGNASPVAAAVELECDVVAEYPHRPMDMMSDWDMKR
jgi:hypothetical protein